MSYPEAETKSYNFSFAFCQLKSCRVEGLQEQKAAKVMGISKVPSEIQGKEHAFFLHAIYACSSPLSCLQNVALINE